MHLEGANPSTTTAAEGLPTADATSEARGRGTADGGGKEQPSADTVLIISVDGLAPRYLDQLLTQGELPGFRWLQDHGAFTHNARSDFTHTVTLPNHTTMLTARPVLGVEGFDPSVPHGYVANGQPLPDDTIHNVGNPDLDYAASFFDVAHDHGLRTCLFAGKDKFVLFEQSYDGDHGAPDITGEDNGRAKLDLVQILHNGTNQLVQEFLTVQQEDPCELSFFHFTDTDPAGHSTGWGSPEWLTLLRRVDAWLTAMVELLQTDAKLGGRWGLILTADHGGEGYDHSDPENPADYTIPFYVVAPGFGPKQDLYEVFRAERSDPGEGRPSYAEKRQPIRNGDAGNLALGLLGLGDIPGSFMNGLRVPEAPAKSRVLPAAKPPP